MQAYLLIIAGALAVAAFATPVVRSFAARSGFMDAPSARKVHSEPMPMLGGAALYIAVVAALLVLGDRAEVTELAGIVIGATVAAAVGLLDDRRSLSAPLKLFGQVGAGLLLIGTGVTIQLVASPVIDGALTILWVVVIANAFNFMDNMDGVAGGVGAIGAGWYLVLAIDNDQLLVAPLAAAVMGACIGFLVYNFFPAKIIMGDAGSLFLGFVLAALAIKLRFPGQPTSITWMIPVFVCAPLLFDLGLVVVSRIRRRVNPFTTAGKDHLSHRLTARGLSTRVAALSIYAFAIASGALGFLISRSTPTVGFTILAASAASVVWALWRLEFAPLPAGASGTA